MSGHSKWSTIKRQKGANDAKRGQLFTKIAREITVAARSGGASPESNTRLKLAIHKARQVNMPNDNIDRAIKRATEAGANASNFEEIYYEAYGPQGTAMMVHALTDNRNRTVGEVRAALTRGGGRLGETGSVAYLFDQIGVVRARLDGADPDEVSLVAIDAGATDVKADDEGELEIQCEVGDLKAVQEAMEGQQLAVEAAEVVMAPKTTISVDESHAVQILRLIERLEDLDDVQEVFSNLELSADVMEKVAAGV
jgi:YebC/PmpR family DNA-binding regulatory protein